MLSRDGPPQNFDVHCPARLRPSCIFFYPFALLFVAILDSFEVVLEFARRLPRDLPVANPLL